MTDTPDIEAIRKRAEAADSVPEWKLGVFYQKDVPALLSHIAALEAEHKAELLDYSIHVVETIKGDGIFEANAEAVAAYLAQKEKK